MHIPLRPPPLQELMAETDPARLVSLFAETMHVERQDYLHWDRVIHLSPPEGLSTREWWLQLKIGRVPGRRTLPLHDTAGRPFTMNTPDVVLSKLHVVDQQAAGRIAMSEAVATPGVRDRYLVSSLIEEAIASSQLEGAVTTRRVAKDMLRSGRAPRDRSEQMIANNFAAMRRIRDVRDDELTPELVCELHRIVTQDTLDDPASAGRLERPQDERVRIWGREDQLLHTPPPAAELPDRLRRMCAFANGEDEQGFMHPVVRAVALHFWMGYDHYFADGNGRTARAVFYWSMLRHGYWLTEFLTISTILRAAPISYAQSFLYTETDDNDLTYFVLAQLDVLKRALDGLEEYLQRKTRELRDVEALLRGSSGLNHRQQALLGHALRNDSTTYSIAGHQNSHGVVYQTARTDLLDLARRRLLLQHRVGNAFVFSAPADLSSRLGTLEPTKY